MPFNLAGALMGAADPQGTQQRLTDRLAAQRQQEIREKELETKIYEDALRRGDYGNVAPDKIMEHVHGIWSDNKQNKKLLNDHGEQIGAFHRTLNALGFGGGFQLPNTGPINAARNPAAPAPYGPSQMTDPGSAGSAGTPDTSTLSGGTAGAAPSPSWTPPQQSSSMPPIPGAAGPLSQNPTWMPPQQPRIPAVPYQINPPPGAMSQSQQGQGPAEGSIINLNNGRGRVRVTKAYPDGSFDHEPADPNDLSKGTGGIGPINGPKNSINGPAN